MENLYLRYSIEFQQLAASLKHLKAGGYTKNFVSEQLRPIYARVSFIRNMLKKDHSAVKLPYFDEIDDVLRYMLNVIKYDEMLFAYNYNFNMLIDGVTNYSMFLRRLPHMIHAKEIVDRHNLLRSMRAASI